MKTVGCEGVDWFQVAQGMVQWWLLVNTVMNIRFHKSGEFLGEMNNCRLLKKDFAPWCYFYIGMFLLSVTRIK
jgi:hypothetical protein